MAVAEAADGLQEQMQRAAATRGTDATAAEAIQRLAAFRRDVVGADTAHAKGPLRLTRVKLVAATEARDVARARHAEHLAERARLEQATGEFEIARRGLDIALAGRARADALVAEQRAARAATLAARLPERPTLAARDERADLVAAAIVGWERQPPIAALDGASSDMLEEELAALPDAPAGDLTPHPDVLGALRNLEMAEQATRLSSSGRPEPAIAGGTEASGAREQGRDVRFFAVPVALFAIALLTAWLGQTLAAVATAGLALAAVAWAVGRMTGRRASERVDRDRIAASESQRRDLAQQEDEARDQLLSALAARGTEVGTDPHAAWLAYRSECEGRSARAAASGRREALEARLGARRQAEASVATSRTAVADAERGLADAADSVGLEHQGLDPEAIRSALLHWQQGQADALEASRVAIEEWHELETLLGGGTLAGLREEALKRTELADRMEAALPETTAPHRPGKDLDAEIEERRRALAVAEAQAAELRGSLESSARSLPDVAEAEEAVAVAAAELAHVESTARTIDETLRLLRQAQERVHRDLAPILADAVRRWLPAVSGGAYSDVSVDPADLSIQVKESRTGIWREARLLSQEIGRAHV